MSNMSMHRFAYLLPLLVATSVNGRRPEAVSARLRLIEFSSDTLAYHVGATLILGPTESILLDAQLLSRDAGRMADSIATLHTRLKAVFITHPDVDHYFGASTLLQRFPGTPVYMTAAALAQFKVKGPRSLEGFRKTRPADTPDSLVTPQLLRSTNLVVDGEDVEIVPDVQGDVLEPANSFVWIPSLRAVLAGDIVFNRVHPWLTASTRESRQRWHQSIARIRALRPDVVVAGHKSQLLAPDGPEVLDAMDHYLTDFDAAVSASSTPEAVISNMMTKYPDYTVPLFLKYSAGAAFRTPGSG